MNFKEGEIISINKPYKVSSFGALAFVRTRLSKALGVKRVKTGHAGTLDPLATGVLILCTGKATKRIEELQREDKEYIATLQFGATTASYDMEHPETEWFPTDHITEKDLRETLKLFVGDIMQVPPAFSACNINGKRAYELARNDSKVELKAKPVKIIEIELMSYDDEKKQAQIRVVCGKGTYIRSLARDIGKALNTGTYLTQLCRTRVGKYKIEDSITFDEFDEWLSKQDLEPYEE
jgi:tRNA pseudouridine55 synthase